MSFLSDVGKFIIVVSVFSFLIGFWVAIFSHNGLIAAFAFASLIGGVYVGLLGIKVSELEDDSGIPSWALRRVEVLEKRLDALDKEKSPSRGS